MRLQDLLLTAICAAPVCSQSLSTTPATSTFRSSWICYDQARQRLSVFTPGQVWEWDGARWARLSTTSPIVTNPVWSTTHNRILAMSGSDVVAFDGHSFETIATVPGPVPGARLIADSLTGEVVVLVQNSINGSIHHRWDGTSWRLAAPTPSQSVVLGHGYDEGRNVLVIESIRLLGGLAYETFEWDGSAWVLRATSNRLHGNLAYDYGLRRIVASRTRPSYTWDGTTWSQLTPGTVDEPSVTQCTNGPLTGGTFSRVGQQQVGGSMIQFRLQQTWSPLPVAHPLASVPEFTFDTARGRAILMDAASMHEFDGNNWIGVTSTAPTQRSFFPLVYDEARQQTVLFGGVSPTMGDLGDTWVWDGSNWTQAAASGPPARRAATLAYDSARQRVVLLGGFERTGSSTTFFADHWEWDGTTWTLVNATTPMSNTGGAAGYDRARNRVVFVEGLGTTWEYDGQTWTPASRSQILTPRDRTLAWNGQRQQLQSTLRDPQFGSAEYAWDGAQWTQIDNEQGPVTYDPARNVLFEYGTTALTLSTTNPASATHYGDGCGGQTIATTLTAFGRPRPGTNDLHLDLRAEAATRPAFFVLGVGRDQVSIGSGCFLRIQNPIATVLSFTDAFGVRSLALPIVDDAGLLGTDVTTQAVVLDPNSPGGLAVTQGLELAIGS
ncbi:MAG: hypothetical protein NXI31_06845 [bacterium]|nr:hypothetical protein [bacterium]